MYVVHITRSRQDLALKMQSKSSIKKTASEIMEDMNDKVLEDDQVLKAVFEEKELRCYLEVVRAIDDDIYCMVYEKHSKNHYLHRIRFFDD